MFEAARAKHMLQKTAVEWGLVQANTSQPASKQASLQRYVWLMRVRPQALG